MNRLPGIALLFAAIQSASCGTSGAQQLPPDAALRRPFIETLSNLTPLAFGMDLEQTSTALGQRLRYVSGRPGHEILLAFRHLGGSGLVAHRHRLFLQFRAGRLTGWKEDYGESWMWR